MSETLTARINREDRLLHEKAIEKLKHFYKYRDSGGLMQVIISLPNSNRQIAMIKWIQLYTNLRWDRPLKKLIVNKNVPEKQDYKGADENPFWNFKQKQLQRRHVSGNEFDPDHFFKRVLESIESNLDAVPLVKLNEVIAELQRIALLKKANL